MPMRYTLLILAILCLQMEFSSCTKPDDDTPVDIDTSTYLPNTFMNSKEGSWWEFGSSGDSTAVDYTRYATGRDTVVEGYQMTYYRRQDHVQGYYTPEYFGTYGDQLVTMMPVDDTEENYVPYVFYIRGSAVGDTWKNTGSANFLGVSSTVKIVSELRDEGMTLSWGGHTFDSVYYVHSEIYASSASVHCGSLELWFSDGLGIIRGVADFDMFGVYSRYYRDSLVDYHIIP